MTANTFVTDSWVRKMSQLIMDLICCKILDTKSIYIIDITELPEFSHFILYFKIKTPAGILKRKQ